MKAKIFAVLLLTALVIGCAADNPAPVAATDPAAAGSASGAFANVVGHFVQVEGLNKLQYSTGDAFLTVYEINSDGKLFTRAEASMEAVPRELGQLKVERAGELFSYTGTDGMKKEISIVHDAALSATQLAKVSPRYAQMAIQKINDSQAAVKQNLMGTNWALTMVEIVAVGNVESRLLLRVLPAAFKSHKLEFTRGKFMIPQKLSFVDHYRSSHFVALGNPLNLPRPRFQMTTGLNYSAAHNRFAAIDWVRIYACSQSNDLGPGEYPPTLSNAEVDFIVKAVDVPEDSATRMTLEFRGKPEEIQALKTWLTPAGTTLEQGGSIHFIYERDR